LVAFDMRGGISAAEVPYDLALAALGVGLPGLAAVVAAFARRPVAGAAFMVVGIILFAPAIYFVNEARLAYEPPPPAEVPQPRPAGQNNAPEADVRAGDE
jgi:hypothetical protein